MPNDYVYLGESKTAIAIFCPKCKNSQAISKELLISDCCLKEKYTCTCNFQSSFLDIEYLNTKNKKNENIKGKVIVLGLLMFLIGIVLCATLSDTDDGTSKAVAIAGLVLLISGFASFLLSSRIGKKTLELKKYGEYLLSPYIEKENNNAFTKIEEIMNDKLRLLKVPTNAKTINITNKTKDIQAGDWKIWVNDDGLNLFPEINLKPLFNYKGSDELMKIVNSAIKRTIPLDKIEYYTTQGEVYRENKIYGGGGGGSSLGGAVVGGIIAGSTGAIIGSRKKNEEIKSELITHDTRETYINYFSNNDNKKSIFCKFKDYQTLLDLMPQKDYSVVSALKTNSLVQSFKMEEKTKIITEQIRELAKLKDEGILTEEEFTNKKKALLEKII